MLDHYTVKVDEARPATGDKPSAGPVYRCIYAKDGLMELPKGIESPWDFFSRSVEKNPNNRMLGSREIVDGKVGPYLWRTYQEAYDEALRIGSAIRSRGVHPGGRCGIYGSNCPEWVIAMEACNAHGIYYVPLYDTLGANAVEFIINHAEVSIAFVQEKKMQAMLGCLPKCNSHLKAIVSFGKVTDAQQNEAERIGVSCFGWKEFVSVLTAEDSYFSFLPLAHVFDQIMETYCIYTGASIGFWRGDVRYLIEDIQELKPSMFCGVPQVFDHIYKGILDKISSGGTLKKMLFQYAYDYKLKKLKEGWKQDEAAPLFDRLVFSKSKKY